ncbi:MAG: AAA family ATPase [Candidatus Schekmanbacteria bacterium]|nr:AAA family ATPase [Candidatus Schekmanbacteria bacterium]
MTDTVTNADGRTARAGKGRERSGRAFGPYNAVSVLGQGGMGVVYRAVHRETGAHVALKTVLGVEGAKLEGIRREIQALSQLRHPGIVRIVDHGTEDGWPWYAMTWIDGRPLAQACGTPKPAEGATMPMRGQRPDAAAPSPGSTTAGRGGNLSKVLTLVRRLCVPLAFLHGEGLVHKDLKPANVLVTAGDRPVLVDFGVAARVSSADHREVLDVAVPQGTILYMAPEQIRGELVDARADLYAVGCILFELLCGRPPHASASFREIVRGHLESDPSPPSSFAPAVPRAVDEIVLALLEKNPTERIGYAQDLGRMLEEVGAARAQAGPAAAVYLYRPAFVGRAAELRQLRRLLVQRGGDSGGLAFIAGESGIGKTRLAAELAREAVSRGVHLLTGECQATTSAVPLFPLERPIQQIADDCAELLDGDEAPELRRRLRSLAEIFPGVASRLRLQARTAVPDASGEEARLRIYDDLAEVVIAYSQREPALLVLDDLQWADDVTIGFLRHLARTGQASRIAGLVLGTYRSEEIGDRLGGAVGARGVALVALDRLGGDDVATVIRQMLALRQPAPGLAAALARHTEGNPFFVAEYLRAAVDEGLLRRDRHGRWRLGEAAGRGETLDAVERLALPISLRETLERRLRGLPGRAREILGAAAVLGREPDLELLARLPGCSEVEVRSAAAELLRRQILEELAAGGVRFTHDKIRELAYVELPEGERHRIHRLAAAHLEQLPDARSRAAEIGGHWEAAGESARAFPHWVEAGVTAMSRHAAREAEALLSRALAAGIGERAAGAAELLRALEARARARDQLAKFAAAAEDGAAMLELARRTGDLVATGAALLHCGNARYDLGDWDAAMETYREALAVFSGLADPTHLCNTLYRIALVHTNRAAYDEALANLDRATSLPGVADEARARLESLALKGQILYRQDRLEAARALFESLMERYRESGEALGEAQCLATLGQIARRDGAQERARRMLEQARQVYRRMDAVQDGMLCSHNLGICLMSEGRFAAAAELYRELADSARENGAAWLQAVAAVQEANCELRRGEAAAALTACAAAEPLLEHLGDRTWRLQSLFCRGLALLVIGHDEAAEAALGAALSLAESLGSASLEWGLRMHWGCAVARGGGDPSRVRALLEGAEVAAAGAGLRTEARLARLARELLGAAGTAMEAARALEKMVREDEHAGRLKSSFGCAEVYLLVVASGAAGRKDVSSHLLNVFRRLCPPEHRYFATIAGLPLRRSSAQTQ